MGGTRKNANWGDEMEFRILQWCQCVKRSARFYLFASYFRVFVWISRLMCGLDNTEQHLHTCHRSIAGANSQPCQENGDLITESERLWETWHMGQCSHNADSFISMILFVSNSFDPGRPWARYQFNKYVTLHIVCTGTRPGHRGRGGDIGMNTSQGCLDTAATRNI